MKTSPIAALVLLAGAGAASAQEERPRDDFRRDFERSMRELKERFEKERRALEERFEQQRRRFEDRERGEQRPGPRDPMAELRERIERLERRLEGLGPRLERALPRVEEFKDFLRPRIEEFRRSFKVPGRPFEFRFERREEEGEKHCEKCRPKDRGDQGRKSRDPF